jgi:hypothetical protein
MSSEFQAKKPKDLSKINNKDFGELMWWSYILGVSPERLLAAIDEVGSSTEQVRKTLKGN